MKKLKKLKDLKEEQKIMLLLLLLLSKYVTYHLHSDDSFQKNHIPNLHHSHYSSLHDTLVLS